MRAIEVAGEAVAWVDDSDYDLVSKFSWEFDGRGYVRTRVRRGQRRITLLLHRVILGVKGRQVYVDHIDHDKLNNLRSNLRICSNSQNQANQYPKRLGQFKGVYFRPKKKAYVAELTCKGKRHYLGIFKSAKRAALAYNKKALEVFGPFALLNKIKAQVAQQPGLFV